MADKPTDQIISGAKAIGLGLGAQGAEAVKNSTSLFADLFVVNWANIASALAAFYVLCQLSYWWWRKFWRPIFERKGWVKPRLVLTAEEWRRKSLGQDTDSAPL